MVNLLFIFTAIIILIAVFYAQYVIRIMLIPKRLEKAKVLLGYDEEKAIAILNWILGIDKGNPEANWLVANHHINKKRFLLALMFLNDILKYNRFTPAVPEKEVREAIAQVYLVLGNVEKALQQFSIMSKKWTLAPELFKRALRLQINSGYFADAKKLVKEAIQKYPQDGEFNYINGLVLMKSRDYNHAETKFLDAERKGFSTPDTDINLAKLYFVEHRYDSALERLKRIPNGYMERYETEIILTETYFFLKDYSSAIKVAEEVLNSVTQASPEIADLLFYAACSYELSGEPVKAIECWKEVDPHSPHYLESKDKIEFYNQVAFEPGVRKFLTQNSDDFYSMTQMLLNYMDYTVKKTAFQDERNIHYLCSNKRDNYIFNVYYVAFSRETVLASIDMINAITSKQYNNKSERLIVIAPFFSEAAITYCNEKGIDIYTIDIFKKYKLIN